MTLLYDDVVDSGRGGKVETRRNQGQQRQDIDISSNILQVSKRNDVGDVDQRFLPYLALDRPW